MTYQAKEISLSDGSPVELYRFAVLTQEWYLTSADEEIVYGGNTYQPSPISRTSPEQSREGGYTKMSLTVHRDHEIAQRYRVYVPLSAMHVTIYRYHRGDGEVITFWVGRVRAVTWEGDYAKLECEPISAQMTRDGLRYQFQAQCNHMLFGPGCGLSAIDYKVQGQVEALDGNVVTAAEFATEADGYFRAGYLVRDLDYRMIVAHTGDAVTLLLPFESLSVGALVDAYAGCDRSRTVCRDKFDNLLNYGGFPFIPNKNPFNKGLT